MDKKYLQLNDIEAYKMAFHLSNYVWDIVVLWEWFPKKTLGSQFRTTKNRPGSKTID